MFDTLHEEGAVLILAWRRREGVDERASNGRFRM